MKKESEILAEVMLEAPKRGHRLFRNNCGQYKTPDGRFIRYGLANPGGSDLIGWTNVTITPEMVGRTLPVFTAVECKTKTGRLTEEQAAFLWTVDFNGGIALTARDVDDYIKRVK